MLTALPKQALYLTITLIGFSGLNNLTPQDIKNTRVYIP